MKKYIFGLFIIFLGLSVCVRSVSAACEVVQGEFCNANGCEPTYTYTCEGTTVESCQPNYHLTNNGCEQNGSGGCECGTNSAGACKACSSGEPNCWNGRVDCQPNSTISPGQPIDSFTSTNAWGQRMCSGIGSAQRTVGNCLNLHCDPEDPNDCWCGNWNVTTYRCCNAGTTEQCSTAVGSTYTMANSYPNLMTCQSGDVYISHVSGPAWGIWATGCNNCGQEDEEPVRWYNGVTTCRDMVTTCSCVSACTSTAPTAPTLTSPANGAQLTDISVGLLWSAPTSWGAGCPSTTRTYTLYLGTTNPPTTAVLTNVSDTVTSTNFTGARGSTYYWYVRASNGSTTASSSIRSFTILNNQITGQVFYDPTNTCGGTGWSTGGVSVSLDGGAGIAVSGTGTFSTTAAVGSSHTLAVNMPAGFACSTGATCNSCSRSGIGSPSPNNNFYLTDSRESWWQAEGAGIYAGGVGGVRSILPSSSLRLILAPVGGTEGILMTTTGTVDTGSGSVSENGWRAISRYRGKKMDFDYFAANMGVVKSSGGNWTVTDPIDLAGYPDDADFGYKNGDASIDTAMDVAAGESYVIFVNGNLDVNANITVDVGGFLAVIVNGTMTVDPSVTALEGLYVIDDSFVTESRYVEGVTNDQQLLTGGTVVAWGTLSLSRSLGPGNITQPAEKFVYRSDLLTNMPDKMKTFVMQWSEVVPGTYQ